MTVRPKLSPYYVAGFVLLLGGIFLDAIIDGRAAILALMVYVVELALRDRNDWSRE